MSYIIRKPGCSCWQDGIKTLEQAVKEWHKAEAIVGPGHLLAKLVRGQLVLIDPHTGTEMTTVEDR